MLKLYVKRSSVEDSLGQYRSAKTVAIAVLSTRLCSARVLLEWHVRKTIHL